MTTIAQAQPPFASKPRIMSAMRSPNFRLYFAGQVVSISGTWMQTIAQGYLVFLLTKSDLWLGIVACAAGLPIVLLSPAAGVIVDRIPRRRILIFTQTAQMILAFILSALTLAGTVQVWHIVVLAVLLGVSNALDMPARQLFVIEMVGRDDLESGIALNSITGNVGRILGPTAAGLALVQFGPAWCFFLNGASFLAVLISLFIMQVPFAIHMVSSSSPLRQLREGVSYSRRDPLVAPLLLITAIGGLLIFPLAQLFPAFADVVLHSADVGYADVNIGMGIGAVVAGFIVGWTAYRFGYGRMVVVSMILTALAGAAMALQATIFLASLMAGLLGLFMLLEYIGLNTMIQTIVSDAFRGRVLSLYSLGLMGLTPFGALVLGALGDRFGIVPALVLYCVLGAVLGGIVVLRWPLLLHGDQRAPVLDLPAQIIVTPAVGD